VYFLKFSYFYFINYRKSIVRMFVNIVPDPQEEIVYEDTNEQIEA
jgi:hypothetical protein